MYLTPKALIRVPVQMTGDQREVNFLLIKINSLKWESHNKQEFGEHYNKRIGMVTLYKKYTKTQVHSLTHSLG